MLFTGLVFNHLACINFTGNCHCCCDSNIVCDLSSNGKRLCHRRNKHFGHNIGVICASHQFISLSPPWHHALKHRAVHVGMLWLASVSGTFIRVVALLAPGGEPVHRRLLWLPDAVIVNNNTLACGISSFLTPQSSGQNPTTPQPYCSIACLICQLSIIYTACRKRETHQHSFRTFLISNMN